MVLQWSSFQKVVISYAALRLKEDEDRVGLGFGNKKSSVTLMRSFRDLGVKSLIRVGSRDKTIKLRQLFQGVLLQGVKKWGISYKVK